MREILEEQEVQDMFQSCDESSRIGIGAGGSVFKVKWHNKWMALKISKESAGRDEISNTLFIARARETAPLNIASHVPEIYAAGIFAGKSIILMEYLNTLGEPAKSRLFTPLCLMSRDEQSRHTSNDYFVKMVIQSVIKHECPRAYGARMEEDIGMLAEITMSQLKNRSLREEYDRQLAAEIKDKALTKLSAGSELKINLDWLTNKILVRLCESSCVPFAIGYPYIPDIYGEGIRSTLFWLASKGIEWGDVHESNVMQRDNGQLVLIDFADYAIKA